MRWQSCIALRRFNVSATKWATDRQTDRETCSLGLVNVLGLGEHTHIYTQSTNEDCALCMAKRKSIAINSASMSWLNCSFEYWQQAAGSIGVSPLQPPLPPWPCVPRSPSSCSLCFSFVYVSITGARHRRVCPDCNYPGCSDSVAHATPTIQPINI